MELIIDNELRKLIPPLTKDEYTLLEENILCDGCRDEIVIWNKPIGELKCSNKDHTSLIILYGDEWVCENCGEMFENEKIILDGHNRYEICKRNNIKFRVLSLDIKNIEEAKEWMIINQFARRNLSNYQRSMLALQLEDVYRIKAKENLVLSKGQGIKGKQISANLNTREELSKIAGVSHDTIDKVKKIEERATDEVKGKLQRQEISINQAFNETKREERKNDKIYEPKELPEGKFSVIYCDPPWPVESIVMDKWESPIDDKYPTMSIAEIKNMAISNISADDCSLFIWATHSFLPDCLDIIKEWGFKYFCLITWNKGSGWTQNGFHKMTEFLLFAYKGKMNINQFGKAIPTLISENKTYHSKKPDSIRELIKSKTPEGRLELFARDKFDGWTAWGNEIKII